MGVNLDTSWDEDDYCDLDEDGEEDITKGANIVDKCGHVIQEGDWIKVTEFRLSVHMAGFVTDVDKDLGYVTACMLLAEGRQQVSYVPINRVSVEVVPTNLSLEDLDVLIDMALDYKDKHWFAELTELRNKIVQNLHVN